MTPEAVSRWLAAFGYEVRYKEGEWSECLVVREGEAWLGAGRDRTAALDDALKKACPSGLARALLEQAVAKLSFESTREMSVPPELAALSVPSSPEYPAGETSSGPSRISEVTNPASELIDGRNGKSAPGLSASGSALSGSALSGSAPSGSATFASSALGSSSGSTPGSSSGSMPGSSGSLASSGSISGSSGSNPSAFASGSSGKSPASGSGRSVLARPQSAPPPLVRRDSIVQQRMDPARALSELEILGERIRDSREELGLCSPDRQRLAMLAWICEARAHTDSFPDDTRIRDRVGAISRQLTEIGKTFWPGSVTALQLQMQPRDLPRHVLGGPASTWSRAAELAERALRSLEYADERRGFDAYGWADTPLTVPPPLRPVEALEVIVREMEVAGGSLAHNAVPRDGEIRPNGDVFTTWIRKIRWLRCSEIDPDRWARAAGRLRWWSCQRDATLTQAARELEPSYAPAEAWARVLGAGGEDVDEQGGSRGHLPGAILEDVRSAISGKRMVFVSTRRDPDLQTQLQDALPAATLDWRVAEPKRLEALGEAIQQGAYDVVLGAIGFQSQGTDNLLARACRQAGIKYLRVNRGRPAACLRALARDLEIIS